jgi:DNA-binding NarL/FixJ family response regulator
MEKTRILIADDHTLFRQGVRALIESSGGDYVVVGEAKDGLDVVAKAIELQPDTVLMDLCMPNQNGMESIQAIKRRAPQTHVIVVTGHCTEEHLRATLEAGADGYVLKDDTRDDLLNALRASREGKTFLSPGICGPLISGYLGRRSEREIPTATPVEPPPKSPGYW